jgi:hypothetical protein
MAHPWHHSLSSVKRWGGKPEDSEGKVIPVRWVGEQHVNEDLGWIPILADWLKEVRPRPWMGRTGGLPLTEEEKNAPVPAEVDLTP